MEKPIKPGRVTALACILMLLVIVFVVALYKLQIVDGKAYYEENRNSVASSQTVEAARGSILDRYGHVLVSNTSCNNLVFNPDDLFEQDDPNGILLQMARTVAACGDTYVDELPVTAKPPFEYTDMNDTQRTQLKGFLKYAGLDEEATAVELMSYCREKFEINNNYSAADMRIIAGLRYSIKTRYIDKLYLPDYVFVQDASMELITSLKENNVPGFEVTVSYTRQYHTNLAAHLLGYTGKMNAEEYTTYKTQGYPMSATVGKDGAELAFEKYLHGTNGTAIVTKNASGTVTGTTYTKEPEPGEIYYGKVVRLMNFGAFVNLLPGKDGMVHISKMADHRIEKVEDAVKEGDMVWVKVMEIDDKGRVNLSMKDVKPEEKVK